MLSGKDKQWIWKIKLSILFSGPYRGSLGTFWVNSDPGVRISGTHLAQTRASYLLVAPSVTSATRSLTQKSFPWCLVPVAKTGHRLLTPASVKRACCSGA